MPRSRTIWLSAMAEQGFTYLIEPRILGHAMLSDGQAGRIDSIAGTAGYGAVRVPYDWEVRRTNLVPV